MDIARTDSWTATRKSFADQFEQDGNGFIYRRSQKGEAIRISASERDRFIDDFDHSLRKSKWLMYASIFLVFGVSVVVSVVAHDNQPNLVIYAGIALAMVPYLVFFKHAWAAPARALEGRMPVAGERSPEEVKRLKFERITYRKLGVAALTGVAVPFFGASLQDVFSGWNRLWLATGGALILLAAVQAFRKWRFEQDDSCSGIIRAPIQSSSPVLDEDAGSRNWSAAWRYVPAAVFGAVLLLLLTPAGKQLAQRPAFWPILFLALGFWAIFTVANGLRTGRIEPIVRGIHNSYDRATQPKRFWASLTWNVLLGCAFIWVAFIGFGQASAQAVQDRCFNQKTSSPAKVAISACSQIIDKQAQLGSWSRSDVFLARGFAYGRSGRSHLAVRDFDESIRLNPDRAQAYYYRAFAFRNLGDTQRATTDFGTAFRMDPKLCGGCSVSQ